MVWPPPTKLPFGTSRSQHCCWHDDFPRPGCPTGGRVSLRADAAREALGRPPLCDRRSLYPDARDETVGLINPGGLAIEYADHIEPLGRRYSFPHETMTFPRSVTEGAKHAAHGPTFRYSVTVEAKATDDKKTRLPMP